MRSKLSLVLLLFTSVITVLGWLVLTLMQPVFKIEVFLSIPIFLALVEGGVILCLNKYLNGTDRSKDVFLILVKVIKIGLSLVFAVVGVKIMNWNNLFLLVFLIYYLFYIVFESWMFIKCNKEIKHKTVNHE